MPPPPRRPLHTGGDNPEFAVRDFTGGVHNFAAREAIHDDESWWIENAIPREVGNLGMVNNPSAALGSLTEASGATPSYSMGFNLAGVPYQFVVFKAQGDGWIINLNTGVATKILNAQLSTSGGTYATQYNNQGILIIDPNGYWDYNVTLANTLTSLSHSLASTALLVPNNSMTGGTSIQQTFIGAGTGGVVQTHYQVISATINAAGTGYVVGDVLQLTDNTPVTAAQILVTAVGGGGAITGISLPNGGDYPGPTSSAFRNTGPTGSTIQGGTGTGATFNIKVQSFKCVILTPGSGYAGNATITDQTSVPATICAWHILESGVTGGTAIATYAGRVWLANNRTVYVSDINSYNSFGGAGTSFTINDAYLFNNITCLYAENNYLYIFGPTSIDALSNVTVSATTGLTSFSRINIVQGIGTIYPASVFGYYRGIMFYDTTGFYLLTGATPEKVSAKITSILTALQFTSVPNAVYGATVTVAGELCAAFMFVFSDTVSTVVASGTNRAIVGLFFRKRWWFYAFSTTGITITAGPPVMVSVGSASSGSVLYLGGMTTLTNYSVFQAFKIGATLAAWVLRTKLWDAGAAFHEKQALNAALGAQFSGLGSSGITFAVDTESANGTATSLAVSATSGYQLPVQAAQGGSKSGAQYLGITWKGDGTDTTQLQILALRGKQDRNILA